MASKKKKTEVFALGNGPGGYTAASRAANLGKKLTLVERYPLLIVVCLNIGCILSKALLHLANELENAKTLSVKGIDFAQPEIILETMRRRKNKVPSQLSTGLSGLAKQRKVEVIQGAGRFHTDHQVVVSGVDGEQVIDFEQAVIAVGSQPVQHPSFPNTGPRLPDSTRALNLLDVPEKLLIFVGNNAGELKTEAVLALAMGATVEDLALTVNPHPTLSETLGFCAETAAGTITDPYIKKR